MDESMVDLGQALVENEDFERAIEEEVIVLVRQNGMRIRPLAKIIGYNDFSATMDDGKVILRKPNQFFVVTPRQ